MDSKIKENMIKQLTTEIEVAKNQLQAAIDTFNSALGKNLDRESLRTLYNEVDRAWVGYSTLLGVRDFWK